MENLQFVGDSKVSLSGNVSRNLKNIKKVWILGYDMLDDDTYNDIYNKFKTINPKKEYFNSDSLQFTVNNTELNISSVNVRIELSDRQYIPGTNLLSSTQITITQL